MPPISRWTGQLVLAGLSTEEISAPGFRGNDHANVMLPLYRDSPEFWRYGAQYDQHLCSDGFAFRDHSFENN